MFAFYTVSIYNRITLMIQGVVSIFLTISQVAHICKVICLRKYTRKVKEYENN